MDESTNPAAPEPPSPTRTFVFSALKLAVLGLLVLVLLIPVATLLGLVRERQGRAESVRQEIGAVWGREQTLGALVLTLPFRSRESGRVVVHRAHLLPVESEWQGSLETHVRTRGIFDVPVYEARLTATGRFAAPELASLGLDPEAIEWERATLTLGVSDLRGIQERAVLDWGGRELPFEPGTDAPALLPSGLEVRLGEEARALALGGKPFSFDLVVRGTRRLAFLPLGEVTRARLESAWADPGFDGAFLPREREVSAAGFTAEWNVPYFGRGFPQSWRDDAAFEEATALRTASTTSEFGVTLVRPADQYQQTERSVKYAILFIVLTFTTLFLLELLSPVRLHPVQYLLVGFALCLFYLLLLALAEHVGFLAAYLAAAAATVALIVLYARTLLASWRRTVPLAATLAGLYAYLYCLLGAEDYALLLGAGGLFVVLALVMFLTRRLDWWTLRYEPGS